MATNEELAICIKAGNTALYEALWRQVCPLVRLKAYGWVKVHESNVITDDDLIQCGFLALVDAVRYYTPEKDIKLNTYLDFTLKNHFRQAYGIRSSKRDAADFSISLDSAITNEEDPDLCISDMLADVDSYKEMNMFFERDCQQRTTRVIQAALETLTPDERILITAHYYEGYTVEKAGALIGHTSRSASSSHLYRILYKLRCGKYGGQLRQCFRDMCYTETYSFGAELYSGTGHIAFKRTGESSVERAVRRHLETEGT